MSPRPILVLLLLALAAIPAAAQQRHPDNTIPPEKIEPAPLRPPSPLSPGAPGGTVTPPPTGDQEMSKSPPADAHYPTPVLPPPPTPARP